MRLKQSFFNRDTNIVAQELLGKTIIVKGENGQILKAMITETEAYHGFDDRASHASRGKTERNEIMFDKAGLVYVYLIYGMYYCLNFTTMPEGFPAAALIRAVKLVEGPGRVTKYLGIDKTFYGEDLAKSKRIWIEDGIKIKKNGIIASERIGVDYAGECKEWEWNYKIRIKNHESRIKN